MVPDEDLLRALRHETRRQILRRMAEVGEPISPRQIGKYLDIPLSNISYHVRCLANFGVVTLTGTRPVRGSVQHFYVVDPNVLATEWVRQMIGLRPEDA